MLPQGLGSQTCRLKKLILDIAIFCPFFIDDAKNGCRTRGRFPFCIQGQRPAPITRSWHLHVEDVECSMRAEGPSHLPLLKTTEMLFNQESEKLISIPASY
jgi:hypothetical protein